MEPLRIGILGGTFDPVHQAHLRLAEVALEQLNLDRMLLVLAAQPPHKDSEGVTSFEMRWRMLTEACSDNPRLEPSDLERERQGPSYTVDTLKEVSARSAEQSELFLLMGVDCAIEFTSWKDYAGIMELAHLCVFSRPGEDESLIPSEVRNRMVRINWEALNVSSTHVRNLVRQGRSIRYLVPVTVEAIIQRFGLYCPSEGSQSTALYTRGKGEARV